MAGTVDYEVIFNRSPNPYMVLDSHLAFVAANDAYLRATLRRREDIIGRNLFDAFPGDPDGTNGRQLEASLRKVLSTRLPDSLALIRYAISRETPEGTVMDERYWSATHTPILDEQGEVKFILQHTVDVTELEGLKKALRAAETALDDTAPPALIENSVFRRARAVQEENRTLELESRHLRRLFEQAPGFIAIVSGPHHVFALVNNAYYQLTGHRNLLGLPVREALPEVEGQGFFELLDRVYATGEPFVGYGLQAFLERQPGAELDEVFLDFVYQPIIEQDGSVSGIFVQGNDSTEQVRAQRRLSELNETLEQRVAERTQELESINRELQEFAYVTSHDLQEPLRKLHSFSDILLAEYAADLNEEARSFLGRIRAATVRMSHLIKDLLVYSRIASSEASFQRVDLTKIVQEVVDDLQLRIQESNGTVILRDLPTVEGDPTQMRQLFQNLIANALKFHRKGVPPRVVVSGKDGSPDGNEADSRPLRHIEVSDNGIGFDQRYTDRIFVPFQRLHTREQYEGTGIGLTICRRIVERHRGSISVSSKLGEGSTFTIAIPGAPEAVPGELT